MPSKEELIQTLPQTGELAWISFRPEKDQPVRETESISVDTTDGLAGDHYRGQSGKRQVTLIQEEHLPAIAAMLGVDCIEPADLRRNLVIRKINLLALRDRTFRIGEEVILEGTGACHPCSKMEAALGPGGYNAMRGHGGLTARVIRGGTIRVGDAIRVVAD